jgi:hypothetical protein
MAEGELQIQCPCCRAKLIVDKATGGVLQFTPHKEAPKSLEDFLKTDKNRAQDLESKFADSRKQEEERLGLLEKKFEWAKKNKDKLPEPPKPGINWD